MIFVVYTKETQIIMKKSKIIVPALGLLVLSTAASVSGTVAWFTANRSYNTSINSIAVVSTTGSLKGSFEAGVGTKTPSESDKTSISVESGAVLTHGSLNHSSKLASWPTDDSANKFDSYTITGTKATDAHETNKSLYRLTDADENKVYTAFTWTLTLTYTTSNVDDDYGLFFDNDKSIVTKTAGGTASSLETYKGFRLAIIGDDEAFVWADNQVAAKCAYVSNVASSNATITGTWTDGVQTATGYTAGELIASDTSASSIAKVSGTGTLIEDGIFESTAEDYYNYLGKFVPPASGSDRELSFLCVAWFEGTDENVVTDATLDTVMASMYFETRRLG